MAELERQLRQLGAEVEYPPTPQLARSVTERLAEAGVESRRPRPGWRPLSVRAALLTAALVLVLAGSVVAAVPAARDALLDLVGLRGATVERVPALSDDVEAQLGVGLGQPTTLESAQSSLAFQPLLSAHLGEPNGVFLNQDPPGGQLSLVYAERPGLPRSRYTGVGLLINEINGNFAPGFFGKLVPRGVRIERLEINGHPAIWVQGLHQFSYLDSKHTFRFERARLADRALLVQHGSVMVRIEGRFGLERALAIARSLR